LENVNYSGVLIVLRRLVRIGKVRMIETKQSAATRY
jgi:hypothetical protein